MALVHPHPARTCITIWVIWMAVKTFINPLLDSNQILWAPDGVGTSVPCLFMPKCLWNSLIKYFGDSFRLEESPDPVFYPWYQPPVTCCTPTRPISTCQEAKTPYIDPFYQWWQGNLGSIWRCCSACVTVREVFHRWSTPSLSLYGSNLRLRVFLC